MTILDLLFGKKSAASDAIKNYNTDEFKAALQGKKAQLIDVRTASEFSGGHINKAKNIDVFNASNFENECQKFNKEEPVYVYCRSGRRSTTAAKKLAKMGFTEVVNLKGGYMAWK